MKLKLLTALLGFSLLTSPCFAYIDVNTYKKEFNAIQLPLSEVNKQPIVLDMPRTFDDLETIKQFSDTLISFHNERIIIRDEGLGGDLFLVRDLSRAILQAKAQGNEIIIEVIGIAASGNAYITCYANKLYIDDGGSLLFHDAGGDVSMFLGFIQYRTTSRGISIVDNMVDDNLNVCKEAKLLTDKDIEVIHNGDDVVFIKSQGQLKKQYEADQGSFMSSGLFNLMQKLSDLLLVLAALAGWLCVWRKAGK